MLKSGGDVAFRETLYLMALTFGRLHTCREAFGRALGLTASQFIVLIGTAYQQGSEGVSIRALADHTQLAATHVTTEVGRLIGKGLLTKQASTRDRRSVLVRLSPKGEDAIRAVNPLLRRVNDLLFADVSREDFAAVSSLPRKVRAQQRICAGGNPPLRAGEIVGRTIGPQRRAGLNSPLGPCLAARRRSPSRRRSTRNAMSELERWEARFAAPGYHFGTEPNAFLKSKAGLLKPGQKALSIADGEGRNGVFLAEQGLDVLTMDFSPTALAKAQALAKERGVTIRTEQADLDTWQWPVEAFDVVVGDLLPVLRAAAADAGVRQHQAGAQARRAVADGGLHAQAAPVQDRRAFRGREPLHARAAGKIVFGFLHDRDRGIRQRNPRRPRTWRHVRADRPRRTQVRIGTNVMIKVLRIGHATFETPDLAKAIEHYTQVIGLSLAGREDKRAFLATKIGQLAIELQQGAQARCSQAVVRGRGERRLRRPAPRVAEARRRGRGAQRFRSGPAEGAVVPGPEGHRRSSCSANGA